MDIAQLSIVYHFGLVLAVLWISSSFNCCHPVVYFICFIYLYQVNERYILKLRKRLHHEEKKQAYQKRLLSDSETVRWLSHLLVKVWPICMEQIASQKILSPIVPWFLEKYKPWTAKKVVLQEFYLGRNPPLITEMRVVGQSADDDHLVLELGLSFLSADDMSAILAVQLRKRLGFGMWTKLHVTGMHVEGKVLVGVKFMQKWPFLQRIRLCFVQPPYFQMTVKPIFSHGLDVTEVPGIAGWLDKILALAFEETLVEPNMLVVDVAKLVGSTESASTSEGNWFSVHEKKTIAYAKVEIIEAADMKPSDPNGLADPYVKGYMGPYRFKTKIQKKTLAPKWQEEFKIPICTWESPNVLELEIRDKDLFLDDTLGNCSIIVNDLRGGQRHDKWLPLRNIKMGRLHMAITIAEVDPNIKEGDVNDQTWSQSGDGVPADKDMVGQEPHKTESKEDLNRVADKLEQINVEGQSDASIWVHHPGRDVSTTWEPRKGRNRNSETEIPRESLGNIESPTCTTSVPNDDSSEEERTPDRDQNTMGAFKRKMGSFFSKDRKTDDTKNSKEALPTPRANLKAEGEKCNRVVLVMNDVPEDTARNKTDEQGSVPQKCEADSSPKGNKKNVAKSIIKHAGKSAHELKHRLTRKISSKSRSSTNREGSDKSNLSDDESNIGPDGDTPKAVDLHVNPSLLDLSEGFSFNDRGHDSSPVQLPQLPDHVMNFRMSVGSCEDSNGLNDNASSSRNSCDRGDDVVKRDLGSLSSSESNTNVVVKDAVVVGSPRTC